MDGGRRKSSVALFISPLTLLPAGRGVENLTLISRGMLLVMSSAIHVEDQDTPGRKTFHLPRPKIRLNWLLSFLAVAAFVVLVSLSLVNNTSLSRRLDDLESRLATKDAQVVNALLQLRVLSYWLAYQTNEPLVLEPPGATAGSRSVERGSPRVSSAPDSAGSFMVVSSIGCPPS